MKNIFVLSIIAGLAFALLSGMLVGASRGRKKAFLRLITLLATFFIALAIAPFVTKFLGELALEIFAPSAGGGEVDFYLDFTRTHYDELSWLLQIILAPFFFTLVFAVLNLISFIVYCFLAATVGKRKRLENGKKEKKGRLLGMLCGVMCGMVTFFAMFMIFDGYMAVYAKLSTLEEKNPLREQFETMFEFEIAGFNFRAEEYYDNSLINSINFFGFDKVCFNYLTSQNVNNQTVALNQEVDSIVLAVEKYSSIDGDNPFNDIDALEEFVEQLIDIKLISINFDFFVDVFLEDQTIFDSIIPFNEEEVENPSLTTEDFWKALLFDKNLFGDVLTALKGELKPTVNNCFDIFRKASDLGLEINNFNLSTLSQISEVDIGELIDLILENKAIRQTIPYLATGFVQPLAEQMGVNISFSRPTLTATDWDNEGASIKKIFSSASTFSELLNIASSPAFNIAILEDFFSERSNIVKIANLMDGMRESKITRQIYDSLTSFDQSKDEYTLITYLDKMVFGEQEGGGQYAVPTTPKTMRALFEQPDSLKEDGVSDRDNIDFDTFNWQMMFENISDAISLVITVKNMQDASLTEMDGEELARLVEQIGGMDPDFVNDIVATFIPDELGIVIPDLNDIDFEHEAEIIRDLFEYQERFNDIIENGGSMEQEDINKMVNTIAESELILSILESANTIVDIGETEGAMILEALQDEESNFDEATIAAIKKIFGLE